MQSVRRNIGRFPADFAFQLNRSEMANLKSQFVTSSLRHGGRRKPAWAFTEQGVAMLSSVLRSPRAVQVNIEIMRAFVRLRQILGEHHDLLARLRKLERKYDSQFRVVFDAIRALMEETEEEPSKAKIGFRAG
jgi:hypothetical protein